MERDEIKYYTEFIAGLSDKPPIECKFKIGEEVIFTNRAGVSFQEMIIIGFADKPNPNGAFIYIAYPDDRAFACAYWFPHKPEELTKVSKEVIMSNRILSSNLELFCSLYDFRKPIKITDRIKIDGQDFIGVEFDPNGIDLNQYENERKRF